MSKTQRNGLAITLFIIFGLQMINTPFLQDKGWLTIIVIVLFNIGVFTFAADERKPEPNKTKST